MCLFSALLTIQMINRKVLKLFFKRRFITRPSTGLVLFLIKYNMQKYLSLGYKANIFQNEKRQVCVQLLCAKILHSRCLTFKISQQNKFLLMRINF